MDFAFTPEQEALRDLARTICQDHATHERLKAIERDPDWFDRELWAALAKANLLGVALPEEVGGSGLGLEELCLLLEQVGAAVAPVPVWPTLVLGALPVAEFGTAAQRERLARPAWRADDACSRRRSSSCRPRSRRRRRRGPCATARAGVSTASRTAFPPRTSRPPSSCRRPPATGGSACSWSIPPHRA